MPMIGFVGTTALDTNRVSVGMTIRAMKPANPNGSSRGVCGQLSLGSSIGSGLTGAAAPDRDG